MYQFLSGGLLMGSWTVAFFFWAFKQRTQDRLFAMFAWAFFLLGLERIVLVFTPTTDESRPYVYLFRLLSFALILLGIVDKNRQKKQGRR